ncbi:MAG: c-type cytochrome [Verrucomicrobiales bacterium]|nr:c-type cytochrome [Verrucomicrobiales bacterium]
MQPARQSTGPRPLPRPTQAQFLAAVFLGLFPVLGPGQLPAATPHWIWTEPASAVPTTNAWFRRTFTTPPYLWNARLTVAADDACSVFLNGKPVADSHRPDQPVRAEVSVRLNQGRNVLAVRARNHTGPAGLLVHFNLGGSETRELVSDGDWLSTTQESPGWNQLGFDDSTWSRVRVLGEHGMPPWGDVLYQPQATPAESLTVLPGFQVELLRSARTNEGSWITLAFDPRGRAIVSPQSDTLPLLRLAFDTSGTITNAEAFPADLHYAMGLLFAHGSLYANAKGPQGTGLYRLTDHNGDDRYEANEIRLLKKFEGGGEHGYHALALGPDQQIYILNGNGTRPAEGVSPHSPYRRYAEDVLSLNPDETSRAGGALAPGCYLLRTNPDGTHWELFAGGMRNAYDFDFSPEGECFTFDSDNEWDWGTPWYRPTRLLHCISGAEAGWRSGTRAWPDHYPDAVQTVADIGIGSPCGVKFGTHARFPEKYRRALYLQDWSYGRILAVHLEPSGATFRGTFETLLQGQPLNLTGLTFGPDGAMYFTTGGRGTQSGLYRVTHPASPDQAHRQPLPPNPAGQRERALRAQLEKAHTHEDASSVSLLWPQLASPDWSLRFAARVALENQPPDSWTPRAFAETNAASALQALLAVARLGNPQQQPPLLATLAKFPLSQLPEDLRLLKLRVIQLSFLRQGTPSPELRQLAIAKLTPRFPATSWAENRELVRILTWLDAPGILEPTLRLIDEAPYAQHQIHYLSQLRHLQSGWTPELRTRFLSWWIQPRDHLPRPSSLLHWFHDVNRDYVDGAALNQHLEGFRRDAIAALPAAERTAYAALTDPPIAGAQLIPAQPRAFVREWHLEDLLPALDRVARGRNFQRGRQAFIDTQCYACHRLGNTGSAIGPELSAVASKYSRRDLLESLVDPSRVISEQFQNTRVFLKDGEDVTGRLVRESATELVLELDPLTRTEQSVPRSAVDQIRPSTVSPMPEGLLSVLTLEEILDLLAFLEFGGRPDAPAFRTP